MEIIRREERNSDGGIGISQRISKLEEDFSLKDAREITSRDKKPFAWAGKFSSAFRKNPKTLKDKVLVICLNSKKEVEEPTILPIISGGIVVYRDKGFKFDPSALYTISHRNKITKVLFIQEDDRFPVGSKARYRQLKPEDIDTLKSQGRYTRNDPILLKMLWNAQTEKKPKGEFNGKVILWIVGLAIAGIVIYMFMR